MAAEAVSMRWFFEDVNSSGHSTRGLKPFDSTLLDGKESEHT